HGLGDLEGRQAPFELVRGDHDLLVLGHGIRHLSESRTGARNPRRNDSFYSGGHWRRVSQPLETRRRPPRKPNRTSLRWMYTTFRNIARTRLFTNVIALVWQLFWGSGYVCKMAVFLGVS